MKRTQLCVLIVLAGYVLTSGAQSQQPPSATFQVSVNYVDVDVNVTDAAGNMVSGLTRDDFEVFEDGKLQKLDTFSFVEIPLERQPPMLVGGKPVTTDVRSNRQAAPGRVYMIVLDDLDVDARRSELVRKSARRFIDEYFGANDVGAVLATSGRTDLAQEFTSDSRLLIDAVDKFVGHRLVSAEVERIDAYYQAQLSNPDNDPHLDIGALVGPADNYDPSDLERGHRAVGVLNSVKNLAEFLGAVRGRRKALLFFSEGLDYPMAGAFVNSSTGSDIIRAARDAMMAAAQANVNVFTLDPRGLIGMTTDLLETTRNAGVDYAGVQTVGTPMPGLQALISEMNVSQDSLRTLAEGTGGFAALNSNSLSDAFDRIVKANSRYYLLGYTPPSHPRDGRFHTIEVRVKKPGLTVVARKGYPSPQGKTAEERKRDEQTRRMRDSRRGGVNNTSADLREVLNSPVQQSGLALSVHAAAFKNSAADAAVAITVEFDGGSLQFAPLPDKSLLTDTLEVSLFGLNESGKAQRGYKSDLNLTVLPATYDRVKQYGVRASQRITLAPGRYQLRVGARESTGGRMGSVF